MTGFNGSTPLLAAEGITMRYGAVSALSDVTFTVNRGEVACLLGDNGAGKSTLIKILSGVLKPDAGEIRLEDRRVVFKSPTDALDCGIATVYQDLAVIPLMPTYRNFWLGREPTRGRGVLRRLDKKHAREVARRELEQIGINLDDVKRPVGTLSGGQRQCVAIARAAYFGAATLILDEPTSALGIREAEIVLQYIRSARERGLGVIFITHNVHHAFPVGDSFTILEHGRVIGAFRRGELAIQELTEFMAGGHATARGSERGAARTRDSRTTGEG